MTTHPAMARLFDAGFSVAPVLNMDGVDAGVLAVRRDPGDLVVVTAWADNFAVGARVPRRRDWSRPFTATVRTSHGPAPFADLVEEMLAGRHRLPEGAECAPFAEGDQ